jgi:hypothetical protein
MLQAPGDGCGGKTSARDCARARHHGVPPAAMM